MNRKTFIESLVVGGLSLSLPASTWAFLKRRKGNWKELNAYYFRAHSYTLVPRQIREDLKWMADLGTHSVSVAILEQDLFAAVRNMEIICEEAKRLGMQVWAVPSRWAGLVAGAPKVPSLFTIRHPETWKKNQDGSYMDSAVSGRISSIFHPATFDFMVKTVQAVFQTWDFKGLIWDEPKSLGPDYHELAVEKLGSKPSREDFVDANADFYSRVNQAIKSEFPSKEIAMFLHASKNDYTVNRFAEIQGLDTYGCDGRPWYESDLGKTESHGKVLLGGVGQRFVDAAKRNGKQSLWLIENHNLPDENIPLLEKRLPEVLANDVDHLIYYYFPRNLASPEKVMKVFHLNFQ